MHYWLSSLLILAGGAWEKVHDSGGFVVERREMAGSDLQEVRTRTHTDMTPKQVFATIWRQQEYPKFSPHSKHLQILRDQMQERIIYEQLDVPVVQDRDYTVRVRFEHDASTGIYFVNFEAANDHGPPERADHTRIKRTRGGWTLEPTPDGGCDVTYVVCSEPGGSVPAWLVARAQRDEAMKFVKAMLDRARLNLRPSP